LKILIFGCYGMLGHKLYLNLSKSFDVYATARTHHESHGFLFGNSEQVLYGVDAFNLSSVENCFQRIQPDVVLNCVGLIKQLSISKNHLASITINSLFPHELDRLCKKFNSKLIHFSTDCVFSGSKGMYLETNPSDALDLYGKSKYLGEVDSERALTLRTSIIGHELKGGISLVDWFLSQEGTVEGYTNAIYSGVTTFELSKIIAGILTSGFFPGLYHVSSQPISKFDLLSIIRRVYKKKINIIENNEIRIDRSLNSEAFQALTSYSQKPWESQIQEMHNDYLECGHLYSGRHLG